MRKLFSVIPLLLLCVVALWAANGTYMPGQLATSISAGRAATGAGDTFFFPGVYNQFTWQVIVSGGTATAITTNLECSLDGGATYSTYDTSTATGGETRSVVNKPALGCRCNIATYNVNSTTAACQFIALTSMSPGAALSELDLGSSFSALASFASAPCETDFGSTTLSTSGATTDTGLSCLPANSVIDAVVYRVTSAITGTTASFQVGISGTAGRFCAAQSTLTLGATGVCLVPWTSATAGTMGQAAAAKIRITANATPTAGAIRLVVYYHTWSAPTS